MTDYTRLRTPFLNMSFTPDVPSNALGPSEYNSGLNVEADVRGIKKVSGEQTILSTVPGHTIFMDGNFRTEATWVYIVATREGRWYQVTALGITNITPGYGANPSVALSGYNDDLNITTSWVGGVFFINDTLRPPMYYRPTDTEIQIFDHAPDNYVWNYGSGVLATRAGFVRNFCSPNVGNILIAGNLTEDLATSVTVNYPTTVRWSQAFANTGVPATWEPTLTNIANEQEVPVRGPLIDGFFLGGNFYVCSYWDTVVFSPIAYQSSTAPIFGVRLFNQGRLFVVNNTQKYQIEIYYPDLNSTGWCNKMLAWRYDLNVWNAPKDVQGACNACEAPVYSSGFQYASRCVAYGRGGVSGSQLVQTGQGNSFSGAAISSLFERNNVVLQTEKGPVPYSSKVYIHRALPEIAGTGTVDITLGGANSTAQTPTYGQTGNVSIVTDNPWVTTQQNSVRTVSIKVQSNDAIYAWNLTAMNWQASVVEDAF